MFKIAKKVTDRFIEKTKSLQKIAEQQKERDVSEADTVTLVKDILSEIFGFDKYQELTSEQQIKGQFCDLAIKIEDKIKILIEVKAAGVNLNASHLKQALNYGVNQGIEWVVLTNALDWKIYKIKFGQPPEEEELLTLEFSKVNPKNEDDQQKLFLLSREGLMVNVLHDHHQVAQIFNKHTVSVVLQTEPVLNSIKKELKRYFPELKIENKELSDVLVNEIIKRDAIDGEKYKEADLRVKKSAKKIAIAAEKANIAKLTEKQDPIVISE